MIWESYKLEAGFSKKSFQRKTNGFIICRYQYRCFVVGFSLAILMISVWYPAFIIGLVTALISITGIYLGKVIGSKIGKRWKL